MAKISHLMISGIFQASGVKTPQSQALLKCEAKVFVELAEEAVSDVYDFYNSLGATYEDLVENALQCAADYDNFLDLVSCVADTLTSWVEGVSDAFETFYTEIISLGEELTDDIYNCRPSATTTSTTTTPSTTTTSQ